MSKQYDRAVVLVATGLLSHDAFALNNIRASTEWAFVSDLKVSVMLMAVSCGVNSH